MLQFVFRGSLNELTADFVAEMCQSVWRENAKRGFVLCSLHVRSKMPENE